MLIQYESMWNGHLCSIKVVEHQKKLWKTDYWPLHSAPYRPGPRARELEKLEISWLIAVDVFEPGRTEWASPTVFNFNKNRNSHIYVTYHKLNVVAIQESYLMPGVDYCIDSLGDATILSTLNADTGHFHI